MNMYVGDKNQYNPFASYLLKSFRVCTVKLCKFKPEKGFAAHTTTAHDGENPFMATVVCLFLEPETNHNGLETRITLNSKGFYAFLISLFSINYSQQNLLSLTLMRN